MKKIFKKISPHPEVIKNNKYLSKLKLDKPALWNFNRKSIRKGVAIGLFCAFLPIPMQMIIASFLAVFWSGNILISIALVWITNPLTIPPIFYVLYKIGAWILGVEVTQEFKLSSEFIFSALGTIWQPLLLGSITVSIIFAVLGYYLVDIVYALKINRRKNK